MAAATAVEKSRRVLARFPASALASLAGSGGVGALHAALRGLPAVIEFPMSPSSSSSSSSSAPSSSAPARDGATSASAAGPLPDGCATGAWAARKLLEAMGEVRLDLRPAADIARGGGYFRGSGRERPTVADWKAGEGAPLAFDTRRGSELNTRLRQDQHART
mmetsp:Transcript_81967/g.208309  ORF Transcript_81967/g.208309 Transcript_81967/m.208309 type:complete len:163 (+) Transcript_81967:64-552(+)